MGRTNEDATDYVSVKEACQIMGKTPKTVYNYLNKGWLETVHKNNVLGTSRTSLFNLKHKLDKDLTPHAAVMQLMEARIIMLESRVTAMMRLLNLRSEPLVLTDPEAESFFQMVEHGSKKGWPPHNEDVLVNSFMRMTEENIEQFERVSGDPHPWRSFLLLAGTMRHALFDKSLQHDIELAAAHLNVLALMWCQKKGDTVKSFDLLVAREATPLKRMINRLEKEKLKTTVAGEY